MNNIFTSYFTKSAISPNAVSIAGKAPDWYTKREYKKLAPKYHIFKEYKDTISELNLLLKQNKISQREHRINTHDAEQRYTEQYYVEVLNKLDAQKVYEELGEDAVLLCWEGKGKFCHRHLVAEWLERELGIEVKEL